jgi:nucleotide-binding universal stress UspA family protein
MLTVRSVLCSVDFSEQSRLALRWAGAFASRFGSRLIVVSVVDRLLADAAKVRLGLDLPTEETAPALQEFVRTTWPEASPVSDIAVDVRVGDPASMILEAASHVGADLIVMGTLGLGGVRKWLLGSTAERVLRRTRTPVLAVPPAASGAAAADVASLDLGRILAATDFSPAASAALERAVQLARQFAVPVLATHVVDPIAVAPQWHTYVSDFDDERVAEARGRLEEAVARIDGVAVETIVTMGRAPDAISAMADERQAGLIVMGLSSEHGAFAPRPGSIAYQVLCQARVPVLVVPAPAEQ